MFRDFFRGLPRQLKDVFTGKNLFWHLLAILLTALLVLSGFDWWYFTRTRGSLMQELSLPAAIIGFFVPIILPVFLYWLGLNGKRPKLFLAAVATAQAGIIGWVVSSTYKAFTGRIQPEFLTHTSVVDISRGFHFGLLEHGIFWGWPSSHTAVAFAMSAVLIYLFPKYKWVVSLAALYAFFIGISVSVSIHWFSDFVAGAILGTVIGITVGRSVVSRKY